ncbi:PfkB family carbohydrate kinase [Geobacter sp. SVR]|uniref:PfkB family carbohydrate kinase n=1 Tax=Geobacter sp. SVR TaxID=2495594 RepID=UPI001566DCDB|nr:PfkB family carbohydrate kinase [Geobacter sp. SVR]
MISIVGGTYYEYCISPEWKYLYGSGLRAAAALSDLCSDIKLHTYVGESAFEQLEAVAEVFGVTAKPQISPTTIRFNYFHGLSVPVISPPRYAIKQQSPLQVGDDVVLQFGMLEGHAVVHGKKVVYDPQSAETIVPFHSNGSTAEQLAFVANMRECRILTGKDDIAEIIEALFSIYHCDVAVIKRGSQGTCVVTKDDAAKIETIQAYKTEMVWPIGSGDVFSAVFAYYWGVKGADPFAAAQNASLATATFCSTQVLPIPADFQKNSANISPITLKPKTEKDKKSIYLAGPFFNLGQRWVIEEARVALMHQNMEVFSPLHDVGRGAALDVASADLKGLDESAVVLAIVDGLDPGTIFEIGYARAKNIPVICLVQAEREEDLKMMAGSDCLMVNDFTTAIYQTAWTYLEL